jgi:hypothetical protein
VALTIWTARAAAALYFTGLVLVIRKQDTGSRAAFTAGLVTYLVHVGFAFHFFYDWSHSIAYRETARQTEELFGMYWGGGLYLNYLFTVLWAADCAFSRVPSFSRSRLRVAIHAFLAFMVLNATVVVWVLRYMQRMASTVQSSCCSGL